MHIESVPNRGSHPTILLRQSYREGKKVRKRTLANLTCLLPEAIETLKQALRGEKLVPADQAFAIEQSIPHGHVKAILGTIRKIGLDTIIASRRSRQRDLVVAMIAERLLHGGSKLAGTRLWHTTTLAEELSVQDADVDELYEAMDWLLDGQKRIEKKLAARHLGAGARVFYDVSSSYYEVACFNPLLADERARKRRELLVATEEKLQRIARQVARRTKTPLLTDEIALKVGKVINRHKVGKHFRLQIEDGVFRWERHEASIEQEAALDGIYVIRTSEPKKRLSAEDTVRSYKNLGQVEQVFRCFKGIDIRVRPIHHSTDPRVRAHVFLCLLAYYVEWHMRRALGSVLFDDEELTTKRKTRDPVAKAKPSASVQRKKAQRTTSDGLVVHSFHTLLEDLGTLCRNRCRVLADPSGNTFTQDTQPTPLHARVFELLGV